MLGLVVHFVRRRFSVLEADPVNFVRLGIREFYRELSTSDFLVWSDVHSVDCHVGQSRGWSVMPADERLAFGNACGEVLVQCGVEVTLSLCRACLWGVYPDQVIKGLRGHGGPEPVLEFDCAEDRVIESLWGMAPFMQVEPHRRYHEDEHEVPDRNQEETDDKERE